MASNTNNASQNSDCYSEFKNLYNSRIAAFYDSQSEINLKKPWTRARIAEVVRHVKGSEEAMMTGQRRTGMQYYWYGKYEVVKIDNEEGIIMKRNKPQDPTIRVVAIEDYFDLLYEIHVKNNHCGRDKLLKFLKTGYYVQKKPVEIFISLCPICEAKRGAPKKIMSTKLLTKDSNLKSGGLVDFIDFKSSQDDGYNFLLLYQDEVTKFIILRPLVTNQPPEVAFELFKIFSIFGAPRVIQSKGSKFTTELITEVSLLWPGVEQSECNKQGQLIEQMLEIRDKITAWMRDNSSTRWSVGCNFVQYEINTTVHKDLGKSPYRALFYRDPKVNSLEDSTIDQQRPDTPDEDILEMTHLEEGDMSIIDFLTAAVEEPAASSPSTTNENEMAHPVSLIKVSTAVDEEMVYAPAVEEKKCGACGNLFSGRVYVCLQCEYQLCAECEASGHHGEHYVLRVPAHKPKVEQEDIVSKMRVLAAKTLRVAPRAKEKKGKSPAIDRNIELETSQQDPLATDSNVEIKFEEDEDLDIDEHFGIPEVSTKVTGRVRKTNNKKTPKTPARTKTTPAASNTGLGTTRLMEIEVGQGTSSDSEGVFIKQEPEEPPESDTEISTEVTGSVRDTYSKKTSKTPARTKTTPAASSTGLGTTRLMEIEVEQATVLDSEGEVFIKQEPEEPPETDPEFQIQIVKVEELDDAPDQPPAKKTRLPNQ